MSNCATKLLLALVLTVTAVGGMLLSAVTAQATTATITGGPSLSGTAATSTVLKLHNSGKTLSCTGSTANGTVAASTTGILPLRVGTITQAFTGCNVVGGLGITVSCQPAPINVNATTVGVSTRGSFSGINCKWFLTTQTACRFTLAGSMGVTFANSPATTMTTDTNHQSLVMRDSTNGAGGACAFPLANDTSARFVNSANGDLIYNVSPTNLNINVTP
jgi:hypothetical protein